MTLHGTRAISADTALRLARYFGTGDRFWLNLQARYALEVVRDHSGVKLEKEVRVLDRASPLQRQVDTYIQGEREPWYVALRPI